MALQVDGSDGTYFHVQPAIEVGGEFTIAHNTRLRPSASVGVTQYLDDEGPSVRSRFGFVPSSSGFVSEAKLDSTFVDVSAGLEMLVRQDVSVSAKGFGSFSDNSESYGGSLRLKIYF